MTIKSAVLAVVAAMVFVGVTRASAQGSLAGRICDLSEEIAEAMIENKKATIAVVEFSDLQGDVTDFGRFLAEELITQLHRTKRFKVVERHMLIKVINEQKLTLSGIVDDSSAKAVGRLLGVDAIVSGSIAELSKSMRINARLISTETGEIFAVAAADIFKDESVLKLVRASGAVHEGVNDASHVRFNGPPITKTEAQGFTFELVGCRRSSDSVVTCEFLVTNNDSDDHVLASWKAHMVDQFGNKYSSDRHTLANPTQYSYLDKPLITCVPARNSYEFADVPTTVSRIALLDLSFMVRGNEFHIKIRDLAIEGK
jgi:TolB-like protein